MFTQYSEIDFHGQPAENPFNIRWIEFHWGGSGYHCHMTTDGGQKYSIYLDHSKHAAEDSGIAQKSGNLKNQFAGNGASEICAGCPSGSI